jgi:hypothetical protein
MVFDGSVDGRIHGIFYEGEPCDDRTDARLLQVQVRAAPHAAREDDLTVANRFGHGVVGAGVTGAESVLERIRATPMGVPMTALMCRFEPALGVRDFSVSHSEDQEVSGTSEVGTDALLIVRNDSNLHDAFYFTRGARSGEPRFPLEDRETGAVADGVALTTGYVPGGRRSPSTNSRTEPDVNRKVAIPASARACGAMRPNAPLMTACTSCATASSAADRPAHSGHPAAGLATTRSFPDSTSAMMNPAHRPKWAPISAFTDKASTLNAIFARRRGGAGGRFTGVTARTCALAVESGGRWLDEGLMRIVRPGRKGSVKTRRQGSGWPG